MKSTDTTKITIAGRNFDVPCLPFAKNRQIVPACIFGLKALDALEKEKKPMTVTDMDHIYLAVFEAVNFCDPKVDRKEFDSWGMDMKELGVALMKIALQTGVMVRKEGEAGELKTPQK